MKRVIVISFKVKSSNALFCMLLGHKISYLTSVLKYKFLILDTCHPEIVFT